MLNAQQTYSDERLDDIARRVFYKAMMKAEKLLEGDVPVSLAECGAIADAAANAFSDDNDGEI